MDPRTGHHACGPSRRSAGSRAATWPRTARRCVAGGGDGPGAPILRAGFATRPTGIRRQEFRERADVPRAAPPATGASPAPAGGGAACYPAATNRAPAPRPPRACAARRLHEVADRRCVSVAPARHIDGRLAKQVQVRNSGFSETGTARRLRPANQIRLSFQYANTATEGRTADRGALANLLHRSHIERHHIVRGFIHHVESVAIR